MQAISIDVSAGHRSKLRSGGCSIRQASCSIFQRSLIFEIYVDPEKAPDDLLAFGDFRADLVHVCDGRAPPPDGRLTALGREAICMCLNHIGIVRLIDVLPGEDDDEIPF